MTLLLLLACTDGGPAWAVHHASVVPDAGGFSGTQTWELFSAAWAEDRDPSRRVCARAQRVTATVRTIPEGCEGCFAAYTVSVVEELTGGGCPAPYDTDPAFAASISEWMIGDVGDEVLALDPWPSRSMGWTVLEADAVVPYGFAYDEALDWEGTLGPAGWAESGTYTLISAWAWDLR
jgi:hypothetical protein